MTRPGVAASLLAACLLSGCATQQAARVPSGDPNDLRAAIARAGRGEGEVRTEPPGPSAWNEHMRTVEGVGKVCLFAPVFLAYVAASVAGHNGGGGVSVHPDQCPKLTNE